MCARNRLHFSADGTMREIQPGFRPREILRTSRYSQWIHGWHLDINAKKIYYIHLYHGQLLNHIIYPCAASGIQMLPEIVVCNTGYPRNR